MKTHSILIILLIILVLGCTSNTKKSTNLSEIKLLVTYNNIVKNIEIDSKGNIVGLESTSNNFRKFYQYKLNSKDLDSLILLNNKVKKNFINYDANDRLPCAGGTLYDVNINNEFKFSGILYCVGKDSVFDNFVSFVLKKDSSYDKNYFFEMYSKYLERKVKTDSLIESAW